MNFHAEKPIYQQIIEYSFARILSGEWQAGSRLPSVRDLAAQMNVNTHTVLKAYEYLQARGIVMVQRGLGYYLTPDAPEMVNTERRDTFLKTTAPAFFAQMKLLGLTIDEVIASMTKKDAEN